MNALYTSERILINNDSCKKLISGGILVNQEAGLIVRIFTTQEEINSWLFIEHGGEVLILFERVSQFSERVSENDFVYNFLLQVYDFGKKVIMPGLIDCNVNICSGTDLEDFSSITKAAAAGGFTTIVDNPM
jgi:allantoinase